MGRAGGAEFTKDMRTTHKIYMPDMLHYHNELLQAAFAYAGYQLEIIPEFRNVEQLAWKYISNDYCSPTVSIISQMIAFLNSPECDKDKTAILEPQTGGLCRAGNIYNLILEVLGKMGCEYIPVISLNMAGKEIHSGFSINAKLLRGCVAAVCYGDLLMTLTQQIRPYEKCDGMTESKRNAWISRLAEDITQGRNISNRKRKMIYQQITDDFKTIEREEKTPVKAGVVGEIYIKFSPVGNRHLEEYLTKYCCDYRLGGFINYAAYVVYTEWKNGKLEYKNQALLKGYELVLKYICKVQSSLTEVLKKNGLKYDAGFWELKKMAGSILQDDYNIGDGWLIAGEAADLIRQGYDRILVIHPFGCLVSHVAGRGIIKKLKIMYPQIRIQSVEFDCDQSDTLRESRILLAIS